MAVQILSPGVRAKETDLSTYAVATGGMIPAIVGCARTGPMEATLVNKATFFQKYGDPVYRVGGIEVFGQYSALELFNNIGYIYYKRVTDGTEEYAYTEELTNDKYKFLFRSKYKTDLQNNFKISVSKVSYRYTVEGEPDVYLITIKDSDGNILENLKVVEDEIHDNFIERVLKVNSNYVEIDYLEDNALGLSDIVSLLNTPGKYVTGTDEDFNKITWEIKSSALSTLTINILRSTGGGVAVNYVAGVLTITLVVDGEGNMVSTADDVIQAITNNTAINAVVKLTPGSAGSTGVMGANTPATFTINKLETSELTLINGSSGIDTALTDADYIKSIRVFSDSELYDDVNHLAVPGISSPAVVKFAQNLCDLRGDIFFVIDPEKGSNVETLLKWSDDDATLNSSYGAVYAPWVLEYDEYKRKNRLFPPSGFVLSQYGFNDTVAEPWYAPAGLNRGVIKTALDVEYNLSQDDRDLLYAYPEVINPIIKKQSFGVVIWGQKTTQRKPSALDRVNVSRLLIHLKKIIVASTLYSVFEPNDTVTWNAWKDTVDPVLKDIKEKRGLYDYQLVMDSTTVKDDDIDQNYMPGIIKIKPTKTAEFIPLDFRLYKTGASF